MNDCTRYLTHVTSIIFFDQYFSSLVAKHWTCCSGPGFDSWLKYRSNKKNIQNIHYLQTLGSWQGYTLLFYLKTCQRHIYHFLCLSKIQLWIAFSNHLQKLTHTCQKITQLTFGDLEKSRTFSAVEPFLLFLLNDWLIDIDGLTDWFDGLIDCVNDFLMD